ncbi:MAG TPA: DUF4192 family protein [Cellulomonas sp.]
MTTTADAARPLSPRSPVLRLRRARDLLAYLPYQLGFRPRDSVVAVSLHEGGAIGVVARVDVGDLAGRSGPSLATSLARRLHADGAERIQLVLYTDEDPRVPGPAGAPGPARGTSVEAVQCLRLLCGPCCGSTVWVVTAQGYLDLDCPDPTCCPPGGRPLDELEDTPVAVRMRAGGAAIAGSREEVGRIALASKGARRSASAARLRWVDARARAVRQEAVERAEGGHVVGGSGGAEPGAGEVQRRAAVVGPAAGEKQPGTGTSTDRVLRWRRESFAIWSAALAGAGGARSDPAGPRAAGDPADEPPSALRATPPLLDAPPPPSSPLRPAPSALGRLEVALTDRVLRDAVLLSIVDPGSGLAERVLGTPGSRSEARAAAGSRTGSRSEDRSEARAAAEARAGARAGAETRPGTGDVAGGPPRRAAGSTGAGDAPDRAARASAGPEDRSILAEDPARPAAGPGLAGQQPQPTIRSAVAGLLDPESARWPDRPTTMAARVVLEGVVAHGRRGRQAPALTVLALLAWWTGDGTRAGVHVAEALRDDPDDTLALLVHRLVDSGLPPAWVRHGC